MDLNEFHARAKALDFKLGAGGELAALLEAAEDGVPLPHSEMAKWEDLPPAGGQHHLPPPIDDLPPNRELTPEERAAAAQTLLTALQQAHDDSKAGQEQ